jgi:Fe-S-cluster containining protein
MLSRQEFFARARREGYTTEQLYSAYEVLAMCPGAQASHMSFGDFKCMRCGNCCRRPWRVEATQYDVLRWIREGRLDILGALEQKPRRMPSAAASAYEARALDMIGVGLAELDDGLVASLAAAIASARDGWLLVPKRGGSCIFYDDRKKACAIYETRPEVCERFPDVRRF